MAAQPHEVQTGLVALKDLIFHKPATRGVCIPSVLRFTYHSNSDVRTKAVRLASNLLWPDLAFQPTIEAFAKEALTSVRSREITERENRERLERERKGDEEEEEEEEEEKEEEEEEDQQQEEEEEEKEEKEDNEDKTVKSEAPTTSPTRASAPASAPTPPPAATATAAGAAEPAAAAPAAAPAAAVATGVRVVSPWLSPPESMGAARVRLSLYFALCVKSRPMLSGLIEAYVTASPEAQSGLMAELPLLAKAAARAFGEPGVVGLIAAAPEGAKSLILVMLDLLVPRETNKPSPELVAAVRRLRDTRVAKAKEAAAAAAAAAGVKSEKEEEEAKVGQPPDTGGIEYMVPILGGLGREGVTMALPSLLQADDQTIRAAFRRLTQPAKGATYTPAELVVLLNQYDFTAAGVPMKRLTRALSLCMDNKTVYNYPVLREALNVMSQVSPAGEERKPIPLLLMRTVMVSVATFPELKNFVATVVLVRLVQLEV
ncbi:unnamed protein product, partial [Laminaria digitata]